MSRARYVPAVVVTVLTLSIGVLAMAVTIRPARLAAAAPADRDRLSAAPATVTLVFTTRPDPARTHVTVVDSAGGAVTSADPRVTGATVVQPISIADAGNYRVGYHATFASGRELSGQFGFTVGPIGAGGPVPPAGQAPRAGPAPPDDAAGAGHAHGAPADPLTVGVLVLDAAVVIGGLVVAGLGLVARRRSARSTRTI